MSLLIGFRHSDNRLYPKLVTWLRGGTSAHCESAVADGGGSRLSLCVSASFMDRGVRGKVIDMSDPHKWRVYLWTLGHEDLMDWLRRNYNVKYDVRGNLGILAPRVGHNKTKKFCSEAVAEHLQLVDPHTWDPARLESYVAQVSPIVVWSGSGWTPVNGESPT